MKPLTRAGEHGTLYRYAITYTDATDECCPRFVWSCWAYNLEHAEDKFFASDDDTGWRIVSIARVSDAPAHRTVQHAPIGGVR